MYTPGQHITIPAGKRIVVHDDEPCTTTQHEACANDPVVVRSCMGPHSTMNGGGYDVVAECPYSGIRITFRAEQGDGIAVVS